MGTRKLFLCLALIALSPACGAEDIEPTPQENADGDLIPAAGPASESEALSAETAGVWTYDRGKALAYIQARAKDPNPRYAYCAADGFENGRPTRVGADCTNFASQVLWAGGVPMQSGWWYRFSCNSFGSSASWRQVNVLLQYLTVESGIGEYRRNARDLQVGDIIFYRLRREEDGYRCDVGNLFNHTTVVSGFDGRGEPLVSYHSNDAFDVPWAAKNGSKKALGEACLAAFIHIKR